MRAAFFGSPDLTADSTASRVHEAKSRLPQTTRTLTPWAVLSDKGVCAYPPLCRSSAEKR